MKICDSADKCSIEHCDHHQKHEEVEEQNNSCSAPCDVDGGELGAMCDDCEEDKECLKE